MLESFLITLVVVVILIASGFLLAWLSAYFVYTPLVMLGIIGFTTLWSIIHASLSD